jgi:hypothetical protein
MEWALSTWHGLKARCLRAFFVGGGSAAAVSTPVSRLISVMKGVLSGSVSLAATGRGAVGNVGQGQAVAHMGFEPDLISGRPFDLSGCAASADP